MPLYRVGKIWYVDLATQGGRYRKSSGTTDKRQAQAYLQRLKNKIWEQEKLGKPPPVTWSDALQKWMQEKRPGLPDRYRMRSFRVDANTILPLSPDIISTALTRDLSSGSINRIISLIRSIHGLSGVEPPKLERRPNPPSRTRFLTKKEWFRLRTGLDRESPLLRQAAEFTLATGLRENNVLELRWDQLDLKRGHLYIEAGSMKNRQALGLPLNDGARKVLKERRGLHKLFVFAHPWSGKPLVKASNKAWYKAVKDVGLKGFRWHDLRHTWASWAVMSGVGLRELMELGGWKTMSMVSRYAHLAPDHLRRAAGHIKPV